jgi:diguanylate cyclase (GGDEF)-like protein
METLAHHDRLTGLPNRLALDYFVKDAKVKARREGLTLTFLYMDLDGFKNVNDTLGHQAGDFVLQEVGQRLKKNVREDEIVVRLGGDEFVMVLYTSQRRPEDNAEVVADRIISALNEPFIFEGAEANIGCSIGGAVWPLEGEEVSDILQFADEALYVSKRQGKNQVNFSLRK